MKVGLKPQNISHAVQLFGDDVIKCDLFPTTTMCRDAFVLRNLTSDSVLSMQPTLNAGVLTALLLSAIDWNI